MLQGIFPLVEVTCWSQLWIRALCDVWEGARGREMQAIQCQWLILWFPSLELFVEVYPLKRAALLFLYIHTPHCSVLASLTGSTGSTHLPMQ